MSSWESKIRKKPTGAACSRVPVNAALMFRPWRWLDAGPGAGIIYFKGDGTPSTVRFVGLASASVKFLLIGKGDRRPWQRAFSF